MNHLEIIGFADQVGTRCELSTLRARQGRLEEARRFLVEAEAESYPEPFTDLAADETDPDPRVRAAARDALDDIDAEHVFPAKGHGNSCFEIVAPYVGDCDYDGAGELLAYLYPGLKPPQAEPVAKLREVDLPGAGDADLMETAYLFVPPVCEDGAERCGLHLVLHGCAQSAEVVGTDFIEQSGYLPWAEANGIVLAFPQVEKSLMAPMNPHGCWDWWGYTGDDYARRSGKQMAVLADWIRALRD